MSLRTRSSAVAILLAAVAACTYSPHPADGDLACNQNRCPTGYACAYNNRCYSNGNVPAAPGTGGTVGHGGSSAGASGSGGKSTGGAIGTGGNASTGGVISTGGTTIASTGGIVGAGGGKGGTVGSGGSTGAGGSTNSGTVVTIVNGQTQGAMTGFGWIAMGTLDSVSDPTCSDPPGELQSGVPCAHTIWSTTTAYCMSGTVPALPISPTDADYKDNWGIEIGINTSDSPTPALGQSFSTVAFNITGSPLTDLRAIVHRRSDALDATYCAFINPGVATAFTSFSTSCWSPTAPGTKLTLADVPNLDQIGIQVSSTSTTITITNLCVHGITFTK